MSLMVTLFGSDTLMYASYVINARMSHGRIWKTPSIYSSKLLKDPVYTVVDLVCLILAVVACICLGD
jgi:hypothetical protein